MLTRILSNIYMFFTVNKIGIFIRSIFSNVTSGLLDDIINKQNQQKAYEFVKDLNEHKELSNIEKAQMFNLKLLNWAKENGQKELSEAVVNCLRELAVCIVKAEEKEEKEKII